MIITLEVNENDWLLNIEGKYNGNRIRKRYRNKNQILEFVDELTIPDKVISGASNMRLLYDDCVFILKNYEKNKDRHIYKMVMRKVNHYNIINTLLININKLSTIAKKQILSKKALVAIGVSAALSSAVLVGNGSDKSIDNTEKIQTVMVDNVKLNNSILQGMSSYQEPYIEDIKESIDIQEFMSLDNRLSKIEDMAYYDGKKGNFDVSSKLDDYTLKFIISHLQDYSEAYENASSKYGIDPYLLLAVSMTESGLRHEENLPSGKYYNGFAMGAMQIEKVHINGDVTAFNYIDNKYETVNITEDKLYDISSNIEIGAMFLQNNLKKYNNNVYLAIQAFNYGDKTMDMLIQKYADENNKTFEEVTLDYNDFGWMEYVNDMHDNPKKYVASWKYSTFGNNEYLNNVIGYYIGDRIMIDSSSNYYIFNLLSNTCSIENKDLYTKTEFSIMGSKRNKI